MTCEMKTGCRKQNSKMPLNETLSKIYKEQLKIDNWIVVNFQMSEQVNRTRRFIGKINTVNAEGKFMVDLMRAASSETRVKSRL